MLPHELYQLLGLPSDIQKRYLKYDKTRSSRLDDALTRQLLCRDTWTEAAKELIRRTHDDQDHLIVLWEYLHLACLTYERYQQMGIPDQVFIDTMKFITRYLNDAKATLGRFSFNAPTWFPRQLALEEFRVGTLEYEMAFTEGRQHIYIHIPSDADLTPDVVDASFEQFRAFLNTYFPAYSEVGPWECDSWMMSPKLRELLPSGSKILSFQNRFELDFLDEHNCGIMNWVFPNQGRDPDRFIATTRLQHALKTYMRCGKTPGWALAHLR
ncbi:MAG: DUF5596 domain-containing protein [Clostridia bacterium]|nr:DUF5596 domain-containing protein [Clostridia bacterium]